MAIKHTLNKSTDGMQIDGLMWINNCVFQGAGLNGRAVDMNTDNGRVDGRTGRPSLYIKGTFHVQTVHSVHHSAMWFLRKQSVSIHISSSVSASRSHITRWHSLTRHKTLARSDPHRGCLRVAVQTQPSQASHAPWLRASGPAAAPACGSTTACSGTSP